MHDGWDADAEAALFAAEIDRQRAARRRGGALPAVAAEPQPPTPPPPGPCEGCRQAQRCREQLLACGAFALFVASPSEARWIRAPRTATRALYTQLFGE
jgi:hypothetical protein